MMIDKILPNALASASSITDSTGFELVSGFLGVDTTSIVRGYLSALLISYPLFLLLSIELSYLIVKHPTVKNLRSRKILIYITLIAAFLMMLGSIITTIYAFLNGSISTNILGHVAVTILIAGSIFIYFLTEVIHDSTTE